MTESTEVMQAGLLLLTMQEVPMGSTVYVVDPKTGRPAEDGDGLLPPLIKMVGGVSIRAKLYPVNQIHSNGRSVTASGFDSVDPAARFTPVEIFTPDTAPVDTSFAAFLDGQQLSYEALKGGPNPKELVMLFKSPDGSLISTNGYIYNLWLKAVDLPPDVQLVATSQVGQAKYPGRNT